MNSLVSVVVPVYNAEEYIGKCMDSVLAQTYTQLEVIVVNDCTPDNSMKVVAHYAAKDARIRVLENGQNMGTMKTRERGYREARGLFVFFMDADDTIRPHAIEQLLQKQKETNADLVCHGYKRIACDTVLNDISVSEKIGKIHTTTSFDTILSKQINIMP